MSTAERVPVYMRIGEDGAEHRIGTVALGTEPAFALVADALAELLRAVAFEVAQIEVEALYREQ